MLGVASGWPPASPRTPSSAATKLVWFSAQNGSDAVFSPALLLVAAHLLGARAGRGLGGCGASPESACARLPVIVSSIAVLIGLTLVNVLQPGSGLSDEARARLTAGAADRATVLAKAQAPKQGIDLLIELVPTNPIKAAADGDLLGWMFFALFFGIGLSLVRTEAARRLEEAIEGLDVCLISMSFRSRRWGVAALSSRSRRARRQILVRLALRRIVVLPGIHQFVICSAAVRPSAA
jgi:hypothetical protein